MFYGYAQALNGLTKPGSSSAVPIPEWVPEGATDYIDFLTDQSWNGETGTAGAYVGTASSSHTSSLFIPENITEDGYLQTNTSAMFALLGETLNRILAGATVVLEWKAPAVQGTDYMFAIEDDTFTSGVEMDIRGGGFGRDFYSYGLASFNEVDSVCKITLDAINKLAINVSADRFEFSLNGEAVEGFDLGAGDWVALTSVFIGGAENALIRSITVYDLQDTADLPALSSLA